MTKVISDETQFIVNTLLEVGERVLEVSKEHIVTNVWYSGVAVKGSFDKYIGVKITDTPYKVMDSHITEGFTTGKNNFKYKAVRDNATTTFSVRILPIHPDKDYLFIVVENLSIKKDFQVVDDRWKTALDAVGDGVWDYNIETGVFTAHIEIPIVPVIPQPTNKEVYDNQITLMDVLATMSEALTLKGTM